MIYLFLSCIIYILNKETIRLIINYAWCLFIDFWLKAPIVPRIYYLYSLSGFDFSVKQYIISTFRKGYECIICMLEEESWTYCKLRMISSYWLLTNSTNNKKIYQLYSSSGFDSVLDNMELPHSKRDANVMLMLSIGLESRCPYATQLVQSHLFGCGLKYDYFSPINFWYLYHFPTNQLNGPIIFVLIFLLRKHMFSSLSYSIFLNFIPMKYFFFQFYLYEI